MALPLSPYSLVARPAAAAATLAAGLTLLLTPRAAQASDPLYEACLDAVHDAALRCLDSADNILGDFACMWAGGLGYLACAVIEAIRQLLPGGLNIT